jgi:hypothetical protein
MKQYDFQGGNPPTVICLRDPVTLDCRPTHGLKRLLRPEYQEMLALYVEHPEHCSGDQESWLHELGSVKRDRSAQKSEWYGIRFEEEWSRSCFIMLLVFISISGVGTSGVLIWRRSWEAGTGFMGAYFALAAFVLSTYVFIISREG